MLTLPELRVSHPFRQETIDFGTEIGPMLSQAEIICVFPTSSFRSSINANTVENKLALYHDPHQCYLFEEVFEVLVLWYF